MEWEQVVRHDAASKVRWDFVPAGCQFRNGLCERRVQAVKRMLSRMLCSTVLGESPMMTYPELQTTLPKAANIINDSPVRTRGLTEEDLEPLTVNMLLLGRCSNQAIAYNEEEALVSLNGMINKSR